MARMWSSLKSPALMVAMWSSLPKLNVYISGKSDTLLLGVNQREVYLTPVYSIPHVLTRFVKGIIAALFTVDPNWTSSKCPVAEE